ncbi:MAG TPA: sensor histidine kinase [Gaiellaceae bacterium]|jgi:two-component system sensor histidine kinase UhpB
MSFSRLPLLWRVFAINATLLVAATLLLALTPVTIHASVAFVEVADLVVALGVMLAANLVLLQRALRPVDRLVERMRTVDLLRPGERFVADGGPEVSVLAQAFNQMLERLEAERGDSGRRALRAQEDERLRIARGLHDEVGQVLTGVLLQLDSLARVEAGDRPAAVQETKQAVRQALDEVRRIARELRPEMLEHLGLVSALTELSRRFADQSGLRIERSFADDLPRLSDESELAVYRVAQESLTNVGRHAHATAVAISLERGAGTVVLRVVDDGSGDVDTFEANGHGGLRGMRERALLVGGALAVERADGGGVEVRLEVPAA